jgi:O-methyltransferase involved in polyketide biosynthesis
VTDSASISPTAHYTGYVWARAGLSHPALVTREGRLLYGTFRPVQLTSRLLGGPSLEQYLLARHAAIDLLLARAIEDGGVTQVIEVACGLSPRGWRFCRRYGEAITYVEADLPGMAARKRAALDQIGALSERHRVVEVDALIDDGPLSLDRVASELDRAEGLAIVTEGLLGYLSTDDVNGVWRRFAGVLSGFAAGSYVSDLHVGGSESLPVRAFALLLSAFVRGQVTLHYGSAADAEASLLAAGFTSAQIHGASELAPGIRGAGSGLVHIIETSIR